MTVFAASDAATTWIPLGIALIALFGAVFTSIYTKRREHQDRRRARIDEACLAFEAECDKMQDVFANEIASLWIDSGYDRDISLTMRSGQSWHTVTTAMNRIERSARRLRHLDPKLADRALAVHVSLNHEIEAVKAARGADTRTRPMSEYRAAWEKARKESDRFRNHFSDAVYDRT